MVLAAAHRIGNWMRIANSYDFFVMLICFLIGAIGVQVLGVLALYNGKCFFLACRPMSSSSNFIQTNPSAWHVLSDEVPGSPTTMPEAPFVRPSAMSMLIAISILSSSASFRFVANPCVSLVFLDLRLFMPLPC